MMALDTNVLVRFLVEDDAEQTRRAKRLVEQAGRTDTPLFVADLVLCELVWVLSYSYEVAKPQLVDILYRLLAARQLRFDSPERLLRAIGAYASHAGDFADYVIAEQARALGCTQVMTFDKKLHKSAFFAGP